MRRRRRTEHDWSAHGETLVQDTELIRLAEAHEIRWIAERTQGARGSNEDSLLHDSEIEAQLAGLMEIMGTRTGTLGLGRRIAIELGPRRAREPLMRYNGDTARLHLDLHAPPGSDLARGWARALLAIIDASGTQADSEVLAAFEQALLALRPATSRRKPTTRQRNDWIEHTFEAFVEAERWTCAGGDVAITTRSAAEPGANVTRAQSYPQPGATREATSWLWHMLRAAIEWSTDGVELRVDAEDFAKAPALLGAHRARAARATQEFARLSARNVANARAAKLTLCAVITYDEEGADAAVLPIDDTRIVYYTRGDDGKPPRIDTPWLAAQIVEAVAGHAREVLGLGMYCASARARREADGRWQCTHRSWKPREGVDGKGDPTYGNQPTIAIEHASGTVTLWPAEAHITLETLAETVAAHATARHPDAGEDATALAWLIYENTWLAGTGTYGGAQSATELLSGVRTGRCRQRSLNAAIAYQGPRGAGA